MYENMFPVKFQTSDMIGNFIFYCPEKIGFKIENNCISSIFPKTDKNFLNDILTYFFVFIDHKSIGTKLLPISIKNNCKCIMVLLKNQFLEFFISHLRKIFHNCFKTTNDGVFKSFKIKVFSRCDKALQ